jgi:hypothetical protein
VTRYSGTSEPDSIQVVSNGAEVSTVSNLASRLDTTAVESLVVLGLGGADTISGIGNLAPLTALAFDGGEDADTLLGGNGADLLIGGQGGDHVDGNQGTDTARLGDGDDRFQWDPGDGSDLVEGQAGSDVLEFNGSNIGEAIAIGANGRRAFLTRNVAGITMDLNGVEGILVHARGGSDSITVGDLAGTGLANADVDLAATGGGGDAVADSVVVDGTNRRDAVHVTHSGDEVLVSGLPALTRVTGSEPALDTLLVRTLGGNDEATVAPDVSDLIVPTVDLGADE